MRFVKGLAVAFLGVVAALGLAGPSQAQGPAAKAPGVLEGVYDVDIGGQTSTWTISPICVPTVGDLREPLLLPVACRLKIAPGRAAGGDAVMVRGQWQLDMNEADGRICPDGSTAPQEVIYRIDPYTLKGEMKVMTGADCGQQPGMVVVPMTLSLKEPLPTPVTQYPLICEPGGLRRCF